MVGLLIIMSFLGGIESIRLGFGDPFREAEIEDDFSLPRAYGLKDPVLEALKPSNFKRGSKFKESIGNFDIQLG